MKASAVRLVEGPLYEAYYGEFVDSTDDFGYEEKGTYYSKFIEIELGGNTYTLNRSFNPTEDELAIKTFDRISASMNIDLEHWTQGSVWDQYREPQTYQEEKDAYYFNL